MSFCIPLPLFPLSMKDVMGNLCSLWSCLQLPVYLECLFAWMLSYSLGHVIGIPFNILFHLNLGPDWNYSQYFEVIRLTNLIITLQLDEAAPILASLKEPIVIAKVNADKFTRLARKYDIEYAFWNFIPIPLVLITLVYLYQGFLLPLSWTRILGQCFKTPYWCFQFVNSESSCRKYVPQCIL